MEVETPKDTPKLGSQSRRSFTFPGMAFAVVVLVGNALQPVINNARPSDLESLLFTFITVVIECTCIIPVYVIEQKATGKRIEPISGTRDAWKRYWPRFIVIGTIFAFATYFVIIGYTSTDATTGGVIVKAQPLSMLLIGYFFLHEKVTRWHILFVLIMLMAVFHVATAGTWSLGAANPGVIFLLIAPVMWNVGHSLAKKMLSEGTITTPQLIFIRTALSSIILCILYFSITGGSSTWQIFTPRYFLFMFLMGINYVMLHYAWYKCITTMDLTFGTAFIIPSPVITATLAALFLGEMIQLYHVMGMAGAIFGLYGLLYANSRRAAIQGKERKKK